MSSENVVSNEVVEGEKTDLQLIQEEVGVLPEVGNNIAVRIYFIITLVAIIGIISGICYIKIDKKNI